MRALTDYRLTDHAREEMARRQISVEDVAAVLSNPEQIDVARPDRVIYQARVKSGNPPKTYLLRVFVDIDRDPVAVVTVYRTSKLSKYWRDDG